MIYKHARTVGCYVKAISIPVRQNAQKTIHFKKKISFFQAQTNPRQTTGHVRFPHLTRYCPPQCVEPGDALAA